MTDYENLQLQLKQTEHMDRIATALEEIAERLGTMNDCIGYYPPRNYMKEGFHFLRIGGSVDTD